MDGLIPVKMQADRVSESMKRLTRKFTGIGKTLRSMRVVMTDRYAVAATDGTNMFFNPSHTVLLSDEQLDSLVMHEALHVLDEHCLRASGKNVLIWGMACDYKVNDTIKQVGMPVNEGMSYNVRYSGMKDEDIYNQLIDESRKVVGGIA